MGVGSPLARLGRARLRTRLLVTYALMLVINVATFYLTVRSLSPVGPNFPRVIETPEAMNQFRATLDAGLATAQLAAIAVSLAIGAGAAVLISRLIVRPIEQMRAAARHMTRGHYDTRVPRPETPELAGIADDLNTLSGRLDETERRRIRLVSDLAHELRTPLTILRGQLDGLAGGLYEPSPDVMGSMSEEVERLRRLTDQLSHLSRAEESAYQVEARDTDLTSLARDVADRARPEFDEAGVELTVTAGQVHVMADADRVSQILVNLLANALAACDTGGRIDVSVSNEDAFAVLQVADTGHGIDPDDLDLIFERFERRTPPGRPAPHHGSGIGLTIARALADAHGGTLTADSAGRGHGAVFTLRLPRRQNGTAP